MCSSNVVSIALVDNIFTRASKLYRILQNKINECSFAKESKLVMRIIRDEKEALFGKNKFDIIFIYEDNNQEIERKKRICKFYNANSAILFLIPEKSGVGFKLGFGGMPANETKQECVSEIINTVVSEEGERRIVNFKTGKRNIVINSEDIVYIKKEGHYSLIYLSDDTITAVRSSISSIKELLYGYDDFIECYRGYVINIKNVKIKMYDYFIMINGQKIPTNHKYDR